MGQHPVHNLIILMFGPNGSRIMANMTVPEPGAKRLAAHLASIVASSHPEAVKQALRLGFSEVDTVVVNPPTDPIELPPAGRKHERTTDLPKKAHRGRGHALRASDSRTGA